jgi:drug/metabolite transporter (DMT)-like permease
VLDGIPRIGEAAALATAVSWSFTALFFAVAGRRLGTPLVNLVRLVLATVLLGATVLVTGAAGPLPAAQAAFLALSGVIGLALGDAAYFRALEYLGARRASLSMAIAPVFTALLMVPLLGESLGWVGVLGMAVTLGGVAWVQAEKSDDPAPHEHVGKGAMFGVLGALGQAAGIVCSKVGLGSAPAGSALADLAGLASRTTVAGVEVAGEPVAPLYGNLLRMATATVWVAVGAAILRRPKSLRPILEDRRGAWALAGGTLLGPFLGVWMSLFAVSRANTAVASTIMATSPIFVIPLVRIAYGEKASWRAWAGAVIAIGGVALLAFR